METDLLAQLIAKKHDVLDQLRQLARRQAQLITEGEMVKLLAILASKQMLLSELQRIERALDPFREQDPDSRRWRSAEDRLRTRQLVERCQGLLDEIMLLEKQGETELLQRRDAAAQRLQGMHTASEARSAYLQPADGPRRLDLSSE